MKAILTYENYYNCGKQYQFKFIYENEFEARNITTFISKLRNNKSKIQPIITKYLTKRSNNLIIDVVDKTNIPKSILIPFISMLISINKCNVTIGNKSLNTFNIDTIEEYINSIHINANINKSLQKDIYYMIFTYNNNEQINDLSSFFNNLPDKDNIYCIRVDNYGNLTNEENGDIIAITIPKFKLYNLINELIKNYNMIITIGNKLLKENFTFEELEYILSNIDINELTKLKKKVKY